jgi:hypothetical protein
VILYTQTEQQKRGEEKMTFFEKAAIVGVWGVAIAAVAIMKKIEPENKVYPFWALALAAINMIVIIWG